MAFNHTYSTWDSQDRDRLHEILKRFLSHPGWHDKINLAANYPSSLERAVYSLKENPHYSMLEHVRYTAFGTVPKKALWDSCRYCNRSIYRECLCHLHYHEMQIAYIRFVKNDERFHHVDAKGNLL